MGDGFGTGSHWVRIGSNTNSTLDSSALIADNSNTIINSGLENPAPGTAGEMRRECHVWLDEDGDTGGFTISATRKGFANTGNNMGIYFVIIDPDIIKTGTPASRTLSGNNRELS